MKLWKNITKLQYKNKFNANFLKRIKIIQFIRSLLDLYSPNER